MRYLLANPEIAYEMGQRGRDAVLSRYNWGVEGDRLLEAYAGIFAAKLRVATGDATGTKKVPRSTPAKMTLRFSAQRTKKYSRQISEGFSEPSR